MPYKFVSIASEITATQNSDRTAASIQEFVV